MKFICQTEISAESTFVLLAFYISPSLLLSLYRRRLFFSGDFILLSVRVIWLGLLFFFVLGLRFLQTN